MEQLKDTKKISPEGCREIDYRRLTVMQHQNSKTRLSAALTLLEMVIAMAIMAIIFAVIVQQFRVIQNSWDSQAGAAETLQNGRVLMDHLYRNLSKAVRITAVSGSAETNGYIEFQDNDVNNVRYDVNSTTNYVQFGTVGDLSDLAGPVSQLQFTCYDANDLDTPITDVNSIRFVKVETTLTNSAAMGQDKTFIASAYLRANGNTPLELTKKTLFEFDSIMGKTPALSKIDNSHYLCAYSGNVDVGWATVLTVDTGTWAITNETPFEFDTTKGTTPALSKINDTHYLCAYAGDDDHGWATVLTVNIGTWTITNETPFEFDAVSGKTPALSMIDNTHYLCAYAGDGDDGWATVLTVNTGTWTITNETPFEFDASNGETPALSKIDNTHYLCAYAGYGDDGWATVLTVDTGTWAITNETPFEFDIRLGLNPALSQMSSTNYLCTYQGYKDTGWSVILKVDTGSWTISTEDTYEFEENYATISALAQLDQTHYLCAHMGAFSHGWAIVLASTPSLDTISKQGAGLEFDPDTGLAPTLVEIDDSHYLCAYQGPWEDGWAVVLETYRLRP